MRNRHGVFGSVFLAAALLLAAGCYVQAAPGPQAVPVQPAQTTGTATLIINNLSAEPIHYIYMSLSADTNWGHDLLGQTTVLEPGAAFTLTGIVPGTWDVKVVDRTGNCKVIQGQPFGTGTYTLDVDSLDWFAEGACPL